MSDLFRLTFFISSYETKFTIYQTAVSVATMERYVRKINPI